MNSISQDPVRSLLRTIVRRHIKQPAAKGRLGEAIARESNDLRRSLPPETTTAEGFGDLLVDRLFHKFLLHGQGTVTAGSLSALDTVLCGAG